MGDGMTGTLLCFGLGYSAEALGAPARRAWLADPRNDPAARPRRRTLAARGWRMFAVRSRAAAAARGARGRHPCPQLDRAGRGGRSRARSARADLRGAHWIGCLGTTAVYGDRQGGWVDEDDRHRAHARARRPAGAGRGGVAGLGPAGPHLPPRRHLWPRPQCLRQPEGRHGTADREAGPGVLAHPRRGHRDRAGGLDRAAATRCRLQCLRRRAGAARSGRGTYAAELLGVEPPPAQPYETAELSPMARTFYRDNRRVRNDRIKDELGVRLAYPSYREGLAALLSVDG